MAGIISQRRTSLFVQVSTKRNQSGHCLDEMSRYPGISCNRNPNSKQWQKLQDHSLICFNEFAFSWQKCSKEKASTQDTRAVLLDHKLACTAWLSPFADNMQIAPEVILQIHKLISKLQKKCFSSIQSNREESNIAKWCWCWAPTRKHLE